MLSRQTVPMQVSGMQMSVYLVMSVVVVVVVVLVVVIVAAAAVFVVHYIRVIYGGLSTRLPNHYYTQFTELETENS